MFVVAVVVLGVTLCIGEVMAASASAALLLVVALLVCGACGLS